MDQAMIDSVLAFPAETDGSRQPGRSNPRSSPTARSTSSSPPSIVDWEVEPGQGRAGLGLQRHGARATHQPRRRRPGRGRDHQRAADRHRHPLARHRRPERPGRRGADHPGPDHAAARPTRTASRRSEPAIGMYHAHVHGEQAVPNGMFGTIYVGDVAAADRRRRSRASTSPPTCRSPRTSRWCSTTPASSGSP